MHRTSLKGPFLQAVVHRVPCPQLGTAASQLGRRPVLFLAGFVPGLLFAASMHAFASPASGSGRTVRLSTADELPSVGLGVFLSKQGRETYQAVRDALELGYRHIDTAQLYRNEADVGQQRPFASAASLGSELSC